jgi:hypothetical protein
MEVMLKSYCRHVIAAVAEGGVKDRVRHGQLLLWHRWSPGRHGVLERRGLREVIHRGEVAGIHANESAPGSPSGRTGTLNDRGRLVP